MQTADSVSFDSHGRMKYHPEYHFANGKEFTEEELEYLCKFWEVDHYRTISFALGRTERSCVTMVTKLRKQGLFDHYKNLNKHW